MFINNSNNLFILIFQIICVREILNVYYFSSFAFNCSTTKTKIENYTNTEMISPRNGAPSTGFSYVLSFKERKNFGERQRMVQDILRQQPDKVPLIVERYDKERYLPLLDHCKYLVPSHITIAEVMQIIRRRLQLHPDQAFYLLVNEKSMASITMTIGHLYDFEKDEDGFLYIVYASQPAFG